jgi:hypothetical protein
MSVAFFLFTGTRVRQSLAQFPQAALHPRGRQGPSWLEPCPLSSHDRVCDDVVSLVSKLRKRTVGRSPYDCSLLAAFSKSGV